MKNLFQILFKSNKVEPSEAKKKEYNEAANFETAISATGFGNFNILLLLVSFPACWSSIFETTTMSYVFPAAQCDLNLSLADKGLLNAITFAGTVSSAFLWGFLFDTFGRKKLLITGFLVDGLIVVLSSFSQNITFLMVTKFIGGFIIHGPFAALTTYLSELHDGKYRPRIPLVMGVCYAVGGIYLPFLASIILPLNFHFVVANYFVIHSWSLFLILNSLPALLSGTIFFFLPESPKFLMAMGKNEEALEVFRKIYSINSGNAKETYPIRTLIEEKHQDNTSNSKLKGGWNQIRPLFGAEYLKILILVCFLQVFMTMSYNTLRLWLPQLFQAINDYKFLNNGTSSNLCEMLSVLQPGNKTQECFVNFDNFEVYVNSMMVSGTSVVLFLITGIFVNAVGQNKLLIIVSFVSGSFAVGIYFASDSLLATIFIAGCNSLASIGTLVVLIVIVNLFPTTLRTMTVSLAMMFGRAAAMMGNIMFPYLLEIGCAPPFFTIASLGFACSILALLLPKRNKNFV